MEKGQYNIICPTDLVPQVMPVDWGYERFGRDLFLPVSEFSSFFGAADKNTARVLFRLFNEHNISSYLANMDAIRNGMFEPSTTSYYVMVRGPSPERRDDGDLSNRIK